MVFLETYRENCDKIVKDMIMSFSITCNNFIKIYYMGRYSEERGQGLH